MMQMLWMMQMHNLIYDANALANANLNLIMQMVLKMQMQILMLWSKCFWKWKCRSYDTNVLKDANAKLSCNANIFI